MLRASLHLSHLSVLTRKNQGRCVFKIYRAPSPPCPPGSAAPLCPPPPSSGVLVNGVGCKKRMYVLVLSSIFRTVGNAQTIVLCYTALFRLLFSLMGFVMNNLKINSRNFRNREARIITGANFDSTSADVLRSL